VLVAVCVAALLIGTVAAMVVTQHLRQEGPIARDIHFKTAEGPRYRVCFRTPRDDTVEVAMVDRSEQLVRVLADEPLPESGAAEDGDDKAPAHCFDWDGVGSDGAPVAPGAYRLRITLRDAGRQGISGEKLRIEDPPS